MAHVKANDEFVLVIGGHSRNIGKTCLMTKLISALTEVQWTAIKISAHRHGAEMTQTFSLTQERSAEGRHDTSRYLSAGAARAYWLRASDAHLAQAIPAVEQILRADKCVLLESNRIVEYFKPDLYLIVLDPGVGDFKESARRLLARADAFVRVRSLDVHPCWKDVERATLSDRPLFLVNPPDFVTSDLIRFVRTRLACVLSTRSGGMPGCTDGATD